MAGHMEWMRSAHKGENYYQLFPTSFVGQTDCATVSL